MSALVGYTISCYGCKCSGIYECKSFDNSAFVKVFAFVRLGSDLAWSRSRGLLADGEPCHPAHKHCRSSFRVKGLKAVRPAWRPVDCRSSEIQLPPHDGRFSPGNEPVVDPAMGEASRSQWGTKSGSIRNNEASQNSTDSPYP
jgi:hypothetical protein